ncbi:hypothetical protein J4E90_005655 [Alternaria incomplexa]|uniref:uncharacterized protein n=1 Tax=Alternaria incomplexa TaxID=1187928 RepID=UPI00221EB520|nr:uncharacterized protein J4E90_005655 [Alternaria incomplexa]KAI4913935.1 hypothetical protein J4E90_005655 [Alternaria incomplexa]
MVGPRNNKKEPAQVPGDRGDVSRLNTRSHSVMAQGHNDFSGSRPGSQRNQSVSADDVFAYSPNVQPNGAQTSRNNVFSPMGQPNYPTMSPSLVNQAPKTEGWITPTLSNRQPTGFAQPMDARRYSQALSQAGYPPWATLSDSRPFNPGPPQRPIASPYTRYREDYKQNLSTGTSAVPNSWLPQLDIDLDQMHNQCPVPSPSRPLLQPYSISSFNELELPTGAAVASYLEEVIWRPSTGAYAVPQNEAEKSYYVKKICFSLVNLSNLWDTVADVYPYAVRFSKTGTWADPRDIEATAHIIVSNAMRIHKMGVAGLPFRRCEEFESLNAEDMDFTFPQRIHYLARLFWHSKVAADNVMLGRDIAKYVALPLTSLRHLPRFEQEWSSMSDEQRILQTQIHPYPQGLRHPTPQEQEQILKHVRMLPSLFNNYMATGGQSGTFSPRQKPPGGPAAPGKRPADGDGGYKMEPAAKRSHNCARSRGDESFEKFQYEEGHRPGSTIGTRSATQTPASDRTNG